MKQHEHRERRRLQQSASLPTTVVDIRSLTEPTSALDPKPTAAIEELSLQLKVRRTVVLVAHNMAQTDRVCDNRLGLQPQVLPSATVDSFQSAT